MQTRVTLVLASLALAAAACGGAKEEAQPPHTANGAAVLSGGNKVASVAYAAPGTTFDVRLDQAIDTRLSKPGEPISATLVQPIRAMDGSVLVAAGTRIDGKVAAIDQVGGPRIVLAFDALELSGGPAPVGTRVLSAQQNTYRTLPSETGVTSMQAPEPGAPAPGVTEEQGQGQGQGAGQPEATTQLSMPRGGVVQLALTRPIIQGNGLTTK